MIFATLVLEREPLRWSDMASGLESWIHDAGGFAALGIVIYIIARMALKPKASPILTSPLQRTVTTLAVVVMALAYCLYFVVQAPALFADINSVLTGKPVDKVFPTLRISNWCLTVGGTAALLVVLLPLFFDAFRWRFRRIWAIARVSFKEAIRSRILWAFSALILVFMFASWFIPSKPENQVRTYVELVYRGMSLLLLPTAGLLAAFSIPNDMKSQAIHTIVTKPVERFEIVIGRFVGYMMLMTVVLAVMTCASLLYVFREINEDAKHLSMRARVPVFGRLYFLDPKESSFTGTDVGREWTYRKYIAGGATSTNRAIYKYNELPAGLGDRPEGMVPCEFSFDIFRTLSLKSEQGKGVTASFYFWTWRYDPARDKPLYEQARVNALKVASQGDPQTVIKKLTQDIVGRPATDAEIQAFTKDKSPDARRNLVDALLAEKFGYYQAPSRVVVDYVTQTVEVPAGLFKNALSGTPKVSPELKASPSEDPELFVVSVKCDSEGQYLGCARHDFYILANDGAFALNFLVGSLGLWLRLAIVIGLCLVLSTYLSGIISFIVAMCIYIGGSFLEFIQELATGKSVGGGPMESLVRLINKDPVTTALQSTAPSVKLALGTDRIYGFILRRILNVIPDTERLDWTPYVAEGFQVSLSNLVPIGALIVVAYILPCIVLGYYLIKWREIASS